MFELTKIITAIILPPFNILILLILALFLRLFKFKKWAIFTALFSIALLYVTSIPYTAEKLSQTLNQENAPLTLDDYRQAQAIVVLGGGVRESSELYSSLAVPGIVLERMRYAAYLHKETELPLLTSGTSANGHSEANVMAQELFAFFGVRVKWLEEKSKNTKENAIYSKEILEREGITRIILVTNQWHMHRAKMLFEKQGFTVYPAPIGSINQRTQFNYMDFLPQANALQITSQSLREWIGYWKEVF